MPHAFDIIWFTVTFPPLFHLYFVRLVAVAGCLSLWALSGLASNTSKPLRGSMSFHTWYNFGISTIRSIITYTTYSLYMYTYIPTYLYAYIYIYIQTSIYLRYVCVCISTSYIPYIYDVDSAVVMHGMVPPAGPPWARRCAVISRRRSMWTWCPGGSSDVFATEHRETVVWMVDVELLSRDVMLVKGSLDVNISMWSLLVTMNHDKSLLINVNISM